MRHAYGKKRSFISGGCGRPRGRKERLVSNDVEGEAMRDREGDWEQEEGKRLQAVA